MNKKIKELKDLNLMDRFLFAEAIEDNEFYEIVLEIILGNEINLIHAPQAEKEVRSFASNRKIVLDVCAVDDRGTLYNTEVQNRNTHNLPKRSRYHVSMIDSNQLRSGTPDFNALNNLYVILIMPFDLFGYGKYRYTFDSSCREVAGLYLEDGVTRIFLNTRGKNPEGVSDELIALLKYFENTTAETAAKYHSDKIDTLQRKVDTIKRSEEVGVKFMNAYEERLLDMQEAFEEGESKAQLEIAQKMKNAGKPLVEIIEFTGLSEADISKL